MRAGCVSTAATGLFPTLATGGAVQTTAKTTPAGLTIATTKKTAKSIRTARERTAAPSRLAALLFVREVFKFGGELAHPTAVVEAADEPAVALVPSHVQELLLGDERAQASQVCVRAVAHDAADDSG